MLASPDEEALAENMQSNRATADDNKLWVQFHIVALLNQNKTNELGRPVYDDVPHIRIVQRGSRDMVDRPVWTDPRNPMSDVNRFPKQWERFLAGQEEPTSGTPLAAWAGVTKAAVEELSFLHVKTVEQLAEMTDGAGSKLMGFHSLRQKARDYVKSSKDQAHVIQMRTEMEKGQNEIATLKKMLEGQAADLAKLKAKSGRD